MLVHSVALLVGSPCGKSLPRQTVTMGIFDSLKAAFMDKEEFDDRTAKAQHILLKGGDVDTRAAAAEAIMAQINNGEITFEKAAREFSECSSKTAVPAGSLGQFEPGKMVPEFDKYVFDPSSPIGEIGIVETQFGTHLVKINTRQLTLDPYATKTDGGLSL
jgi:parvulin-like peptidyl-prolyl isomerase